MQFRILLLLFFFTVVSCNFLRSIKIQIHFPPNQQQINAFLLQLILLFIFCLLLLYIVVDDAFDSVGCISLVHFLFSLLSCVRLGSLSEKMCTLMQIYALVLQTKEFPGCYLAITDNTFLPAQNILKQRKSL